MGQLRIKADEYEYKEADRRLKEQFISGTNVDNIITEIMWESSTVKKISKIFSEQVLTQVRRVEAQRAQTALIETTKDNKEINTVKRHEQKNNTPHRTKSNRRETHKHVYTVEIHTSREDAWQEMLRIQEGKTFWESMQKPEQTDPQRWQEIKNCSWHEPKQWESRGSNTGVWHSKIKSFQLSHQISFNCKTKDKSSQ